MPATPAASPIITAALVVLFGAPVLLFIVFAVNEDVVRRNLGWLGRYMPVIIPVYAALIGTVGWMFQDPHTLMLGAVVAAFTLKPLFDAWRRRRRG